MATCCKSTQSGVAVPTVPPTSNDPDLYIQQTEAGAQFWVWTSDGWTMVDMALLSYDELLHTLYLGDQSVVLPLADNDTYGLIKLGLLEGGENQVFSLDSDGNLTIDCLAFKNLCNLRTLDLVSTDSDNALTFGTDGGIYYSPPVLPDTSSQYVHPTAGNDSNTGTRASPLATITEAFSRINSNAGIVYLYESTTNVVASSNPARAAANVTIRTYGPTTDTFIAANAMVACNWYWFGADTAPRAVIQLSHDALGGDGSTRLGNAIGVHTGNCLTFQGIALVTDSGAVSPGDLGGGIGMPLEGASYHFYDCSVTINDNNLLTFASGTSLVFVRTALTKVGVGFAIHDTGGNGSIEVVSGGGTCGAYTFNIGTSAAVFASTFMDNFVLAAPTYKNVVSSTL